MKKHLLFFVLVFAFVGTTKAQTRTIVVLGSSTAEGIGTSTYIVTPNNDSCWVSRLRALFNKNTNDNIDTLVINLGHGGKTTYDAMPTGFIPPANRPSPDPTMNITLALTYNPDAIIVNFPSNDITVGFNKHEIMDNFRLLTLTANNGGAKCFITTTQPRDDLSTSQMQDQRDLVDSIQNVFGANSIDFWSDLVNPNAPPYTRRPEVVYPVDAVHVNDLGHRLIFLKASVKPFFTSNSPLPLKLLSFEAVASDKSTILKWTTTEEEPNTKFEIQRSTNGREFESLAVLDAVGNSGNINYTWIDQRPLDGKSFYRLKINESSKISYSRVVTMDNKANTFNITSVYLDATNLHINLKGYKGNSLELSLINLSGAMVKKQKLNLTNADKLAIPIGDIPAGEYILRLVDNNGNTDTQRFTKLK